MRPREQHFLHHSYKRYFSVPEGKTMPVVVLHEHEETRYYSMKCIFHIMVIRLKISPLPIHFEVLIQGKPLNLESMFYTNDCVKRLWLRLRLRVGCCTKKQTFSFLVGHTHYCQAQAGRLLHLLHSKHIRPELLDDVWCRKTQNSMLIQVTLLVIANTVHKNTSYKAALDTISSDKSALFMRINN